MGDLFEKVEKLSKENNPYDKSDSIAMHDAYSDGFYDGYCKAKYEPTYVQSLLDKIKELKAELENFKKVDEDYLNILSRNYEKQLGYYEYLPEDIEEAYKAGYRRAKEE